ncbi:MAG: NAD-dependent epimerase/dehydratase family protein [Chloroflexi bacterium]|nr:NAD-dependent epimerase/dehydratase family protein [Chloroflexota bacterium]
MRSLITGVGGFAGQHLAARLLTDSAAQVFGVARTAVHWHDPDLGQNRGLELVQADLLSAEEARRAVKLARPDHVYLLAAQSSPPEAFVDPLKTITNNVACVVNVLEALRDLTADARVLVVSSAAVYGSSPAGGESIGESAPMAPDNPYAVSKAVQDMLGYQYYASYGLQVIRVRPFNHIGPGQDERFAAAGFAKQITEAEAGRRDRVIDAGNLSAERDFTDVRDMVRAYQLALVRCEAGKTYNLASGRARSVQSLLDGLAARSSVPITVRFDPTRARPVDAPILVGDASLFRERSNWVPEIPFEQTLQDILDDWRRRVGA